MDQLIKKRFYFLRHGRTDWNDKSLCQGQIDIPLNQKGINEVEQVCPLISTLSFSKIITSPLSRAVETAKIVQKHTKHPLEILHEIQERSWGIMEGFSSIEMYRIEEEEEKNSQFIPGYNIELRSFFKLRILQGLNEALKGKDTPLIVSHGRVFLVLSEILEIPLVRQIPNATVIECNPLKNGWNLILHSI